MRIDDTAPVRSTRTVEVDAPPGDVWRLLVDVERWPEWNGAIRDVSAPQGVRPGATFRWRSGPGTITSTFEVVDPERELSWTGRTMGISAVHVHRLAPHGEGTRVTIEESWTGLPVRLMRRRSQQVLDRALESGLSALRIAAR